MRVTENSNRRVVQESIHRSRSRMEDLQFQGATLKKLNTPSDDPVSASKVLELRTEKMNGQQYLMNAKMAEAFLQNTDQVLSDLCEIVLRAKELAIQQASTASSSHESRIGVAEEVSQLYAHAIATANRKVGERFLLGGFSTQNPPISPQGEYEGDSGEMKVEVGSGVLIAMNVPGSVLFQDFDFSLFDELQKLRIALLTGHLEGVQSLLEPLDDLHSHFLMHRAQVGSRLQGLLSSSEALERHSLTHAQLNSVLEDADMAQVVSDLNREETIFKSALSSAKRLLQPTLLDFLR